MCGILGVISPVGLGMDHLSRMPNCEGLTRRGPDHFGSREILVGQLRLLMTHSRLSIVDRVARANQPFESRFARGATISYNGEVFNYRNLSRKLAHRTRSLLTESDTEVVLEWLVERGIEGLVSLEGQWALAFWDPKSKKLLLARDRFGVKPLFYAQTGNSFYFGSDIRDVVSLSGLNRANFDVASVYLHYGDYDFDDVTFFEGVRRIPPGSYVEISLANPTDNLFGARETDFALTGGRWHEPVSEKPTTFVKREDAVAQARELLILSVSRQVNHSNLPAAFSLSGGIDSSLLVGIARREMPDLDFATFSYSSPGFAQDERKWAGLVVEHNQLTNHHFVEIGLPNLARDLVDLVSAQGEPFISLSLLAQYTVMKNVAASGYRVVYEGQGADELFGGYSGYPEFMLRSRLERLDFLGALRSLKTDFQTSRSRSDHLLNMLSTYIPRNLRYAALKRYLGRRSGLATAFHLNDQVLFEPPIPYRQLDLFPMPLLDGWGRRFVQRLRFATYENQLDMLLRHGDRNAMNFGVENRVPFLSEKLADFLFSLRDKHFEGRNGLTKSLLREIGSDYLPSQVLERRDKVGFSADDRAIVLGLEPGQIPWEEGLECLGVQHIDAPIKYVRERVSQGNYSPLAWRIINLGLWASVFGVSAGSR